MDARGGTDGRPVPQPPPRRTRRRTMPAARGRPVCTMAGNDAGPWYGLGSCGRAPAGAHRRARTVGRASPGAQSRARTARPYVYFPSLYSRARST